MLVRDRMTPNPITVTEDTPFQEALRLVREKHIRRLPVVDGEGNLVGIVSEKDLLYAAPSPRALSIFELHYHLAKLKLAPIINRKVITTTPDTPLEEAARIMVDYHIGALPVLENGQLVGIITETDIFKTFLELLGARENGLRLTLHVPDRPGVLAALTGEIARYGGNIIALGAFNSPDPANRYVVVKIRDAHAGDLVQKLAALGQEITDVREV